MAKDVETKEQIAATASISAADTTVGEIIAEAMDKVGKEGVITVEESNTFGLDLELTEGMRFDKGYISAYFVTDPERMEAVLEDPYVLIANSKVSTLKDLLPAAGEGHAVRQAAADHRRGRRRRGASRPWSSTRSGAPSSPSPSRPRASVTAARPCCRTSPS